MKKNIVFAAVTLAAVSLVAGDSSPKDDITSAARKLADKPNYSWHTTVAVPEDAQFRPGPTDGKTEKDGFTHVKASLRDNTAEFVLKGGKAAVTNPDSGGWQTLAEIDSSDWPGRMLHAMVQNFKAPSAQAVDLVSYAKDLKKDKDLYSSDLTETGVKTLLTSFRPRRDGDEAPTVTNAKGSVKFWIKDGVLAKYEFKMQGTVSFNGNDRDIDRTTTVEIKDVGTTKVEVPEEAKKKLS